MAKNDPVDENGILEKATVPPQGETYVFPDGVKGIAWYAFDAFGTAMYNEPLIIPEGVTEIGAKAFILWKRFNNKVVLPSTLESIGDEAFAGWTCFNQPFIIPDSVWYIGKGAFVDWLAFNSEFHLSTAVKIIQRRTFSRWQNFNQKFQLHEGITEIQFASFSSWHCFNHLFKIPQSVKRITLGAFDYWGDYNQGNCLKEEDGTMTILDSWMYDEAEKAYVNRVVALERILAQIEALNQKKKDLDRKFWFLK